MAIDRVIIRLDALIAMGEEVIGTLRKREGYAGLWADEREFRQWRTSCLAFLKTLPSEYIYSGEFESCCTRNFQDDVNEGVAVLRAAKEDIDGGYLQKVEVLVSASVFSDFLEMAEHLLDNGYKDPAASLIGAVLEDGMRRICGNNDLSVKSDDNISSLNQKIADKGVYNRLKQREIEVWNKLRDYADHGHFEEYQSDNMKDMLGGVQKFLSDYLV